MSLLQSLHSILSCPDDGSELRIFSDLLECVQCKRQYPSYAPNLVELLPLQPSMPDDGSAYAASYATIRKKSFEWREDRVAWGAPEVFPAAWVERRNRQVTAVRNLICEDAGPRNLLCDFSAGAGYYTLEYANDWKHVVHCDLSVNSLTYTHRKAAKLGVQNILFVRMDYLRPPFRRSLQRIICLDSLVRGDKHETRLLHAIQGSLGEGGKAIVDFHNWWHNPVRRLGLLTNNFGANRSYSRGEVKRLVASAGIANGDHIPFHQEIRRDFPLKSVLEHVLPPTRLMYRFGNETNRASS